jgi:L-threonylcarbamoyladenylate synthase
MNTKIKQAIQVLNGGGVVIFPTDTAFGIGCRMDNEKAAERIFELKKRPEGQAFPVLVSSPEMAKKYLVSIPKDVKKELIDKYWPGALTIVLPCKPNFVSPVVLGGGDTLGVRMPDNEVILKIIEEVGVPILGPSANIRGVETPYSMDQLDPELIKQVDFVLPSFAKASEGLKKEMTSTVIDCSVNPWKILREGAVKISNIKNQKSKTEDVGLIIDTSGYEFILVRLILDNKQYIKKQKIDKQKSQVVLPMIQDLLKKHKLTLKDLTSININQGPGSFTGLRVGLSIANALSKFLNIPINNQKPGTIVEPIYK